MTPEQSIYKDIAARTGGDIYIGVVGPVRTGKSTFIKRFMEALVLPGMEDGPARDRARDELPQSAGGKTVMTTEPKFIPDEAVAVTLSDGVSAGSHGGLRGLSRPRRVGHAGTGASPHGAYALAGGADALRAGG